MGLCYTLVDMACVLLATLSFKILPGTPLWGLTCQSFLHLSQARPSDAGREGEPGDRRRVENDAASGAAPGHLNPGANL